ncbi:TPA: hypothetical protein ACIIOC_004520, partial [Salmonella enterica subsp. enterica serovar Typhimurium]
DASAQISFNPATACKSTATNWLTLKQMSEIHLPGSIWPGSQKMHGTKTGLFTVSPATWFLCPLMCP